MTNQPAVSVIIPTFNRANFVRQAIESVLQQRFQDYELIVVDDGSTDETRAVVESLGSRVRYLYQSNRGAAAARNFGVRHAGAPWIAFQDSDDLCAPDHLESLYGYVCDHPDCGMVFANGAYLDGPKHNRDTIIPAKKSRRLQAAGVTLQDLFAKSIVRLQASIILKSAYDAVGGMDNSLCICHDLDLFFRLSMSVPIKYLDRVVFFYRKHDGNISYNEELRVVENIKVIEKFLSDFPDARDLIGRHIVARRLAYRYYRLAKGRWKRKQLPGALEAIDAAVARAPYSLKYRVYRYRWGLQN